MGDEPALNPAPAVTAKPVTAPGSKTTNPAGTKPNPRGGPKGSSDDNKPRGPSSAQKLEQAVLQVCVDTSEKLAVFVKHKGDKTDSLRRTAAAMDIIKLDNQAAKETQTRLADALVENSKLLGEVKSAIKELNTNIKGYLALAFNHVIKATARRMKRLSKSSGSSSEDEDESSESEAEPPVVKKPKGSINVPPNPEANAEKKEGSNGGNPPTPPKQEVVRSPSPPETQQESAREGSCSGISANAPSISTVDSVAAAGKGDLRDELQVKKTVVQREERPRPDSRAARDQRAKSTAESSSRPPRRSRTRSRSRSRSPRYVSYQELRRRAGYKEKARSAYLRDDDYEHPHVTIVRKGGTSVRRVVLREDPEPSRRREPRRSRDRSRSDSRDGDGLQKVYKKRR